LHARSRTQSGEFQIVNHHLLRDLTELGLWDNNMRNKIIAHNGSIQVRTCGARMMSGGSNDG